MSKVYENEELGIGIGWPKDVDPENWRNMPDPDLERATEEEIDSDMDDSISDETAEMLGFDPRTDPDWLEWAAEDAAKE